MVLSRARTTWPMAEPVIPCKWPANARDRHSRETGRVKTLTLGHERPLRHSRESGNPGVLEGSLRGVSPLHPAWIPAFAGMTVPEPVPYLSNTAARDSIGACRDFRRRHVETDSTRRQGAGPEPHVPGHFVHVAAGGPRGGDSQSGGARGRAFRGAFSQPGQEEHHAEPQDRRGTQGPAWLGEGVGHRARRLQARRGAPAQGGLRDAPGAEPQARLLLDIELRTDRSVGVVLGP